MKVYKFNKDGNINKEEYIRIHTKLAKIFRNDLKENALKRLMEEEWKHDTKGNDYLGKQELFNGLFELVDVWTPDIDAHQ